jgi:hypothetical protein
MFLEEIKTHVLCSVSLFFENRAVYEQTWKNTVQPVQATNDNMTNAHCMLDN